MACLKFLEKCWATSMTTAGHDKNVLSSLKLLKARPGYVATSLPIEQRHINNHKTVHGGVMLTLTDTVTSLAISTLGVPPPTGVSINISTEFVRPGGKISSELYSVGEVIQLGKTMAYTKITFYTPPAPGQEVGKVIGWGSHTKFMGGFKAVTKFSEDGEKEMGLPESTDGDKAKL